jgi:copper(I)-binding protein
MLLGIARTTRAGDRIPVTLEFASGTRLRVVFEVETGLSAPAPSPVRRMDPDARHMGH